MEPTTNNSTSRQGSNKRCPSCGASNKIDAGWCGQCLEKFEETVSEPEYSDEDARALDEKDAAVLLSSLADDTLTSMKTIERPSGSPDAPRQNEQIKAGEAGPRKSESSEKDSGSTAFQVSEEGITWKCLRCDTSNAMEERACTVCGTTFAEAIQPVKEEGPPRDPNKAALASLAMPGAGHAYLGMWPEGIARAIISIWVVAVTVFTATQGTGLARIMALLFGFVATGLWLTAAHDAYREASGMSGMVLLKRKFFLWLVLGLLLMSIVMIFATAVAAGG